MYFGVGLRTPSQYLDIPASSGFRWLAAATTAPVDMRVRSRVFVTAVSGVYDQPGRLRHQMQYIVDMNI